MDRSMAAALQAATQTSSTTSCPPGRADRHRRGVRHGRRARRSRRRRRPVRRLRAIAVRPYAAVAGVVGASRPVVTAVDGVAADGGGFGSDEEPESEGR
ncbi:hypothetical protein BRD13_06905 [Halobacteriales archaeon SW_5_70_135]|nr:MAG: hypothetical protein BRD13_06905 [Halobacteriales archaeon SW_5_70_135]